MTGKFVSFSGSTIVLAPPQGGPSMSYEVDPGATVTRNGAPAMLADFQVNDKVKLTGDPATSVEAHGP